MYPQRLHTLLPMTYSIRWLHLSMFMIYDRLRKYFTFSVFARLKYASGNYVA